MYKVKQSDCIGELEGFPIEVVQKMVEEQVNQGNRADVKVFQKETSNGKVDGGFTWEDAKDDFWSDVIIRKNFDLLFQKYPKQEPKELNLVEILKDAPRGTKLYSPLCGEVKFNKINDSDNGFPISVTAAINGYTLSFSIKGLYFNTKYPDAECLLFPSKENRDWSTFKIKKPDYPIDTPMMCSLNKIDWCLRYYAGDGKVFIDGFKRRETTVSTDSFLYTILVAEFDFEKGCRKQELL